MNTCFREHTEFLVVLSKLFCFKCKLFNNIFTILLQDLSEFLPSLAVINRTDLFDCDGCIPGFQGEGHFINIKNHLKW